jgi:Dyggve-Melchior-Clausen syndrome protein
MSTFARILSWVVAAVVLTKIFLFISYTQLPIILKQRASTLEGNDPLALLLYQVASPAHLPWNDTRWNELLHGYDVWVHLDEDGNNKIISAACQSMAKHAGTSSNLATLSLHVTRMLRDLFHDIAKTSAKADLHHGDDDDSSPSSGTINQQPTSQLQQPDVADFSTRISLVAKARATAGALKLLSVLCHPVIVSTCQDPATASVSLREAFTYHTRGDLPSDQPAGFPLMHSLFDLIVVVGHDKSSALVTPEVYDVTVFAFQLLLVLCSTQLYQPFHSSFERKRPAHYILEEIFQHDSEDVRESNENKMLGDNNHANTLNNNHLHLLWSSDRSFASHGSNNDSNRRKTKSNNKPSRRSTAIKRTIWTPRNFLGTCLEWQINRPPAPPRSLAHMYYILAQNAVTLSPQGGGGEGVGGEKPGPDGMYESYMVVQATAPESKKSVQENDIPGAGSGESSSALGLGVGQQSTLTRHGAGHHPSSRGSLILDATKGVLTISGSIFLLPFRLMSLVYGVLIKSGGGGKKAGSNQEALMNKFSSASESSRTRDVLWLTDSILADLSCSVVLLLSNNNRNSEQPTDNVELRRQSGNTDTKKKKNPFRTQLHGLTDNRWEDEATSDLPDLPNFNIDNQASFTIADMGAEEQRRSSSVVGTGAHVVDPLSLNFELLFDAFGRTLHTEVGALLLYTLLQSSPAFAESLAVRSDLDTLVMPLLRTLYFSSRSNTYMARDYATKGSTKDTESFDIRSFPFRSQSQLYVIIILLLIFSQDVSFGRDAFQRTTVSNVLWYKERKLKNINLGSVVLLTLLRMLLFNLNRIKDGFLLSNCCAVLINLSHAISDLHDYASMRLASVTVTVMKKHAKLAAAATSGNGSEEKRTEGRGATSNENGDPTDELSNPLAMHAEVAHTLLELVKQGVAAQTIEGNLHLVYALVYHQVDLIKLCKNTALYKSRETERIQAVTLKASSLIQKEGARSAPKALKVLETNMEELKAASQAADDSVKSPSKRSRKSSALTTEEFLPFTYQEETDPEIFFLPYVWDIIVCVMTASTMEWKKDDIQAFNLLDEVELVEEGESQANTTVTPGKGFSKEVDGIV